MGGHIDDAERDLRQPLVSMSLGCDAVFLMGFETREEPPTPILVRSGDVIVLSGRARRCYHGLPRILDTSAFKAQGQGGAEGEDGVRSERERVEAYLASRRINISVRAVT